MAAQERFNKRQLSRKVKKDGLRRFAFDGEQGQQRDRDREEGERERGRGEKRFSSVQDYYSKCTSSTGRVGWCGGRDLPSTATYPAAFCRGVLVCWQQSFPEQPSAEPWPNYPAINHEAGSSPSPSCPKMPILPSASPGYLVIRLGHRAGLVQCWDGSVSEVRSLPIPSA